MHFLVISFQYLDLCLLTADFSLEFIYNILEVHQFKVDRLIIVDPV